MKIKVILLALLLIFSGISTSTAKEPIFTVDISDTRKLLYGEKETFISCWSTIRGTIFLDVKVNGKWKQKAKSSLRRDFKNCSDKKYPGVSKLIWTPNELSSVKGEGRTYILKIRERVGSILKPTFVSNFTIPIYRSSSDLISDVVDRNIKLPSQTPTSSPIPVPTTVPVPTPVPEALPSLVVGQMYSGIDIDNSTWKWVAVKLSNTSASKILSGSRLLPMVSLVNADGAVVDSSRINTPPIFPGSSGWLATTQFNTQSAVRALIESFSPKESEISRQEFPGISSITLVNAEGSSVKKSVQMTLKNNSERLFLHQYSNLHIVLLNSSGIPIYAESTNTYVTIAPGGSATIKAGFFSLPGDVSSIEVSIRPSLCKVPESSDFYNCITG
jgi:hypothetical protein